VSYDHRESNKNHHHQPTKERNLPNERTSKTKPNKRTGKDNQPYRINDRKRTNQTEELKGRETIQLIS